MLREKYSDLESQAATLGIKDIVVKEEGGKLSLSGTSTYQLEKDLLWDSIKKHAGWENEVAANIKVEKTDIHGIHTVEDRQGAPRQRQPLHGDLRGQPRQAEGSRSDSAWPATGDPEPLDGGRAFSARYRR